MLGIRERKVADEGRPPGFQRDTARSAICNLQ
jgi:hypothetical protein